MCFQGPENGSCCGLGLGCKISASTPYFLDPPDISSFRPQSWCCGYFGEENSSHCQGSFHNTRNVHPI